MTHALHRSTYMCIRTSSLYIHLLFLAGSWLSRNFWYHVLCCTPHPRTLGSPLRSIPTTLPCGSWALLYSSAIFNVSLASSTLCRRSMDNNSLQSNLVHVSHAQTKLIITGSVLAHHICTVQLLHVTSSELGSLSCCIWNCYQCDRTSDIAWRSS